MIVAGSTNPLLLASAGGYNLTRSLRFRSSASAYISKTLASSGNRKTWTYSAWVKRGTIGSGTQAILFAGPNGNGDSYVFFDNDGFGAGVYGSGGWSWLTFGSAVYRDPASWYHIVVAIDTTQATSSNRVKLYVNGVQITAFSTASYPSLNFEGNINNSAFSQRIGVDAVPRYFDGYLTEVNFIDGQALTPSSFGETSTTTGVWQPKRYAGTYGTNGFYLPFTDNSALTTSSNVGLGKDFSGNGNYWTTNNISITSGATYDSMTDVPTLTSATASNFCTWNPLDTNTSPTITGANLNTANSSESWASTRGTIAISSGKWYFETTIGGSGTQIGVYNANTALVGDLYSGLSIFYACNNGYIYVNSVGTDTGVTGSANDVIGVALDLDLGTVKFFKNNTQLGSTVTGVSGTFTPAISHQSQSSASSTNFGQRPFAYTPPTGFVALNTFNLPTPTIGATASTQANKYMDISLYTGNGSTQSVTNSGSMQPDMVWMKSRSNAYNNLLHDSSRGVTQLLIPNGADAQETVTDGITSFNSNGFSLGANGSYNQSTRTYVGWQWKVNGGTTSSNTSGSITSTVQVGASQGISIVTYTGTGANATVGHGLGVAPKMIIIKNRTGVYNWRVWHTALSSTELLYLNATDATVTGQTTAWNSTLPSSTVFSLGSSGGVNESASTFVAYCFSEVAGYSKFGSYTGNGSSDGPFVYLGFRPYYLMVKNTTTGATDWIVLDGARDTYNVTTNFLRPNLANAEGSGSGMLFLSNGFKWQNDTGTSVNQSGATFIYMAFAENPMKYSLAR